MPGILICSQLSNLSFQISKVSHELLIVKQQLLQKIIRIILYFQGGF